MRVPKVETDFFENGKRRIRFQCSKGKRPLFLSDLEIISIPEAGRAVQNKGLRDACPESQEMCKKMCQECTPKNLTEEKAMPEVLRNTVVWERDAMAI